MEFEKISRVSVPELDAILGEPLKVLDDGFIRVVDYMGTDESIVQAARVSYGKGTKKVSQDQGLIRYLMRHWHTTPFEMCEVKVHVRVPMDAWRQWIRHRTANVNEYSTRYSLAIDAAQQTPVKEWRLQSANNRQGSAGFLDEELGKHFTDQETRLQNMAREVYEERLEKGIAREQARKDLPLSTYTEAYWKVDLHNLLHFLYLRFDDHAQLEIREYARVLCDEVLKRWCPITYQAFMDYRKNAYTLTDMDQQVMKAFNTGGEAQAKAVAAEFGWYDLEQDAPRKNRERKEFLGKAETLGLSFPFLEEGE